MLVLWWSVDVIMCLLSLTGTTARSVRSFLKALLWEAIVNRTYGAYENLCISLFLPTISGPIYCDPPVVRFRAGESRSEEGGWVSDPVFYLSAKSSSQDYSTHAFFCFVWFPRYAPPPWDSFRCSPTRTRFELARYRAACLEEVGNLIMGIPSPLMVASAFSVT